jgi:hypothetical protein
VQATLFQIAHVVSDVPLIIFRQPAIRTVVDGNLRLGSSGATSTAKVARFSSAERSRVASCVSTGVRRSGREGAFRCVSTF